MKYIILIIFSILLSNGNGDLFSDTKKTFSKNKLSKIENIYVKYDSLYVRYNLLLKEIYSIRQSIYDLQDSAIYTANNLSAVINSQLDSMIKGLESEILYNATLMIEQDSVNASHIDDIKTSFEASRFAQKLANQRVKKDNKDLLKRVNKLETEINELKRKLKK